MMSDDQINITATSPEPEVIPPPVIPSAKMPQLLEAFPGGYFEPTYTEGLDKYLEVTERLADEASADAEQLKLDLDQPQGTNPPVAPATPATPAKEK